MDKVRTLIEEIKKDTSCEAIVIYPDVKEEITTIESKLSGYFYLPRGKEIPTDDSGKQLLFLAQINCGELPENNIYPKAGIIQFWIFSGDDHYGADFNNLTSDNRKRVIYYPEIEDHYTKEELDKMIDLPIFDLIGEVGGPFRQGLEFSLSFEKESQGIQLSDYRMDSILVSKWNKIFNDRKIESQYDIEDISSEIYDILYDEFNEEIKFKISGYPTFNQVDPRESEYEDYTELLLQIPSMTINDEYIDWGDAGVAAFFGTKDQLKNLDFKNTLYTWDC